MSLAITDRKQHQWRPGGCVRIFLQFWDWNRRLAKKKLAPNKLPPPVRAGRKLSKKFSADEKMPIAKLLLINDEYRGSFPSNKKLEIEGGNGMRAPGLVARLMGLESMPAANHEKPRKAMDSKGKSAQDLRSGISGIGKTESRAPKLRKTGELLQRQLVEHDQCVRPKVVRKNGSTSRSSNKHHNLTSTVRSPRLLSNSSKARLMQAATKFLEPGSQHRYHAKGDVASADSSLLSVEATGPATNLNRPREVLSDSSSMSCTSYDSLVRMSRSGPIKIEPFRSDFNSSAFQFNVASSSRQYSMGNSTTMAFMPAEKNSKLNVAIQTKINVPIEACKISEGKHKLQNPQTGFKLKPDYNKPKVSNNFRHSQPSILKQKVADQVTNRPKVYSTEQSLNDLDIRRAFIRSSGLMLNDCRVEMGKSWEKNIASKRKSNFCSEDAGMFGSVFVSESTRERSSIYRNNTDSHNNQGISRNFLVGDLTKEKNHDSISKPFSCTFSSTKSSSHNETAERCMNKYQLDGEFSSNERLLGTMSTNLPSLGRMNSRGKEISSLVKERIRNDELETLDTQSSSSIFDELINNLASRALSEKHDHIYAFGSSNTDDSHSIRTAPSDLSIAQHQMHSTEKEYMEKTKFRSAPGLLLMDDNQPSPVPILAASFSNDYYSYGSRRAYSVSVSGNQSRLGSTEKQNTAKYLDTDIESEVMQSNCEKIQQSMDINQRKCTQLQRKKLDEARQTISNAEVTLKNFALYVSCGIIDFALESFLIDMLEVTVGAFRVGKRTIPGQNDAEDKNHIQQCLFDCMIQSLASRYSHFFKSGYKILPKNPFFQTENQFMIREVHNEIKGWINLAGKILDDLIQKELYDSTIMWKDCEIEALETGTEIEREILEALVYEMVTDL